MTPREIAIKVPGFRDEKQVRAVLRKILSDMIDQPARELLALQFHRYESLLRSIWAEASRGSLDHHDRIYKLMAQQEKLLGLGSIGVRGDEGDSDVDRWLWAMVGDVQEAESDDLGEEDDTPYP
jgi:hypothetical protein